MSPSKCCGKRRDMDSVEDFNSDKSNSTILLVSKYSVVSAVAQNFLSSSSFLNFGMDLNFFICVSFFFVLISC